jgi:hypothetical protein
MLVRQIKMVVVQLDIRREPFEILVKKPFGTTSITRVFFLVIEDDDVSVIVRDPIALTIPMLSDMPSSIKEKIAEAETIGAPVQGSVKEALLKRKLLKEKQGAKA